MTTTMMTLNMRVGGRKRPCPCCDDHTTYATATSLTQLESSTSAQGARGTQAYTHTLERVYSDNVAHVT